MYLSEQTQRKAIEHVLAYGHFSVGNRYGIDLDTWCLRSGRIKVLQSKNCPREGYSYYVYINGAMVIVGHIWLPDMCNKIDKLFKLFRIAYETEALKKTPPHYVLEYLEANEDRRAEFLSLFRRLHMIPYYGGTEKAAQNKAEVDSVEWWQNYWNSKKEILA